MSKDDLLTRREFTVESALAMLAGVAITITGCNDSAPPAPSPVPTDITGAVSTDAGHSHTGAVITAAQFTAGNAITLTLTGASTHHTRWPYLKPSSHKSAEERVCRKRRPMTTRTHTR